MHGALFAPLAVFLKLYLPLHCFLVLAAVIVNALALSALKFDQIYLRHIVNDIFLS